MAKYIDADKIRQEIERLQEMYLVNQDKFKVDDTDLSIFYEGKAKMCGELLSFLDTLQESEVASLEITPETEWADVDAFVHKNCDGAKTIIIRKNAK